MTLDEYNTFCDSLTATCYVVQWRGAHVWKVGGKVFAIGGANEGEASEQLAVTFKVSPLTYEILQQMPGLRGAPYFASRGMKWIQHYAAPGLGDDALREHVAQSHFLAASKLTKKAQRQLQVGPIGSPKPLK